MTDLEIRGRTAVVTGAGGGIGRALALKAAAEGMALAICDVDADGLAQTAAQAQGAPVSSAVLDVRDAAALQRFAAGVQGSIGLLFANAGLLRPGPLLSQPVADIQLMFDVNVLGAFNTVQAFAGQMTATAEPSRVVITGSQASFAPFAGLGGYCATKHALAALAECLAQELVGSPVGVSLLAPGAVSTAIYGEGASPNAASSMSAQEAAEIAFAGARRGDFLISTHADLARRIEARLAALQAMLR